MKRRSRRRRGSDIGNSANAEIGWADTDRQEARFVALTSRIDAVGVSVLGKSSDLIQGSAKGIIGRIEARDAELDIARLTEKAKALN
jgi:hypothetical protein